MAREAQTMGRYLARHLAGYDAPTKLAIAMALLNELLDEHPAERGELLDATIAALKALHRARGFA